MKKILILAAALVLCACSGRTARVEREVDRDMARANIMVEDAMQDVDAAFEGGYNTNGPLSPEERDHTEEMAVYCHTSEDNIRALRRQGLGWYAIAEKYGLNRTKPAFWRKCRGWQ